MSDNCFGAVLEAFERLDVDNVTEGRQLERDLGMDSQEIVALACELERAMGIKLAVGEIKRSMTVQDVVSVVQGKLGEKTIPSFSLTETINMNVQAERVSRGLYNVREWSEFLANVVDVEVLYDDGVFQEFRLSAGWEKGQIAKVRTVRKRDGDRIAFFQPEPEAFLKMHCGEWAWRPNSDGSTAVSLKLEWCLDDAAGSLYPSDKGSSTGEQVKSRFRKHIHQVLTAWKKVLEERTYDQ